MVLLMTSSHAMRILRTATLKTTEGAGLQWTLASGSIPLRTPCATQGGMGAALPCVTGCSRSPKTAMTGSPFIHMRMTHLLGNQGEWVELMGGV